MKIKSFGLLLGSLVLILGSITAMAGTSPFIIEGKSNGVPYASGGVGKDEQMQMDQAVNRYNVKLVFVEAPRDYVSDVTVRIEDHKGKELMHATSNGPWFFAKLPKGDFRIVANFRGHSETKTLKVGDRLETLEFLWNA